MTDAQPIDIWQDDEFLAWYDERPPVVQAMIERFPPDQQWRVQGGVFPGHIYAYDEAEDDTVTFQVVIESPFLPRTVFGLEPKDLEPWVDFDAK